MKKYIWLVIAVSVCTQTWAGTQHNEKLFGVDESFDELIAIDPSTGAAQTIGATGFASISSLASDSTGILFGTDTASRKLVTLDKQTGAASEVGPTGIGEITGLAFAPDGTLFGAEAFTGQLVTVEPTTGTAFRVGSFGITDGIVTGLAFDASGTLFGVASGNVTSIPSQLLTIDVLTGEATIVGSTGVPFVTGLSFSANGTLYGVSRGADELLTINTATGAATSVGPLGGGDRWVGGIDFVRVVVNIDIKPGSDSNCFNVNGHGVVPVAVLGSDNVDVTDIDVSSLLFAGFEVRIRGNKGPLCSLNDTNADGFLDLVCHFEDSPENWMPGDGEATLTGELLDGTPIEGSDSICIVP